MPQYVTIGDEQIEVPQVYPVWLPGTPPPWAPAPKPYDENAWTGWGRAHYGETWFESRQKMLRDRNIYSFEKDKVYLKRQRRLRAIEDAVEGRQLAGGVGGAEWKDIWASILKQKASATELSQDLRRDAENSGIHLTTSSTGQVWEELMRQRDVRQWNEEEYRYQCMELGWRILREAKNRCEDAIGGRKHKEVVDELNSTYDKLTSKTGSQSHHDDQSAAAYDRTLHFVGRLGQGELRDRVMSDWTTVEERVRQHEATPREEEAEVEAISQGAHDKMIGAWLCEYMTSTGDDNNTHRPSTSGVPSQRQSLLPMRLEDATDPDHDDDSHDIDSEIRFITGPSISLDGDEYAGSASDIDMHAFVPEESHSPAWSYDMISAGDYERLDTLLVLCPVFVLPIFRLTISSSMTDARDTEPAGQNQKELGRHASISISSLFGRRKPSPTKRPVSFRTLCGTISKLVNSKRK